MFHFKSYFGSSVEAEARVTLGSPPPCSGREMGQLWFNGLRKDLHICDGLIWTTLLQSENHAEDSFFRFFWYISRLQQTSSITKSQQQEEYDTFIWMLLKNYAIHELQILIAFY